MKMSSIDNATLVAIRQINLPSRPGTIWEPDVRFIGRGPGVLRCKNCGKNFNDHGAPADVAASMGILKDPHLLCHASDEAWADYWQRKRRATADRYVKDLIRDLRVFDIESRLEVVRALRGIVEPGPNFCIECIGLGTCRCSTASND